MKIKNIALAALMSYMALPSCNTHSVPENEYLIEGTIQNIPDSTVIMLLKPNGQLLVLEQKDTIINGSFSFRDTVSTLQERFLLADGQGFPGTWRSVWVAPGKYITVNGEDKLIPLWNVKSDIAEQQEENAFVDCAIDDRRFSLQLMAQDYDLQREASKHTDNPQLHRTYWQKIDSIRKIYEPIDKEIQIKEMERMLTSPVSEPWIKRLASFAQMISFYKDSLFTAKVESVCKIMPEELKQSDRGKAIIQYVFPQNIVNIGDNMADGDLYDSDGRLHHLAELKGKYILLDFWSRGCGPCIESIPEIDEIASHYKDRLAVVGISLDPKEMWIKFLDEKKLAGNQWNELKQERTGVAASYQVQAIPHYVLISPEGKIIDTWTGYGKGSLKEKMKKHLGA